MRFEEVRHPESPGSRKFNVTRPAYRVNELSRLILVGLLGILGACHGSSRESLSAAHRAAQAPADRRPPAPSSPVSVAAPSPFAGRAADSKTDHQIADLQTKLKRSPDDPHLLSTLGRAYLQKIRESSDPAFYPLADGVLTKAAALAPSDLEVIYSNGSLALGRHQFEEARKWGRRAVSIDAHSPASWSLLGDAQVELGAYDDAATSYQKMADLKPGMAAYSRVSYMDELYGNLDGAVQAMQMAAEAGSAASENGAWCSVQLGNLYMKLGRYSEAQQQFERALYLFPGYLHAEAALGSLKASEGKNSEAIALYEKATNAVPTTAYLSALGDLYARAGRKSDADRLYNLVTTIDKLYQANGVGTDLEMALFEADHGIDSADALARATREYQRHPTVRAADALAWTLFKTGNVRSAGEYSSKALRLGTREPMYFYHAAKIAEALGLKRQAEHDLEAALAHTPNFSVLYADDARTTLKSLQKRG
jgi:tetratricopeptide (TPR) repeat protein